MLIALTVFLFLNINQVLTYVSGFLFRVSFLIIIFLEERSKKKEERFWSIIL